MAIIGVPKEIKTKEGRVGLTPAAVKNLVEKGHSVFVEYGAGVLSDFTDNDYLSVGAFCTDAALTWTANTIVKVKEPLESEYEFLRHGQIVYTFFHFPDNPELKKVICQKGVLAMPYENIEIHNGQRLIRPILAEMSKIAAEIGVIDVGAHYLRAPNGGSGVLLKDAVSIVIGYRGTAGRVAHQLLTGLTHKYTGRECAGTVVPFEIEHFEESKDKRLWIQKPVMGKTLSQWLDRNIKYSADLVICCAAAKNTAAPKLITREMVKTMRPGSVIVDIAIDEGGCCETSRPTTHDNPVFVEEGVIHYCVANMPGSVPRSSTPKLVEASLPFLLEIADKGWERALAENPVLATAAQF